MQNEYYCPHCNSHLKVNKYIILTAKQENGYGGIVLFEPKLGDYKIIKHNSCLLEEGERVEFLCPVCHKNLSSEKDNFAEITLKDPEGDEYKILFSEIIGEHATYKIKAGKVQASFGEDSQKYMNFFGSEPIY